MKHIIFYSWQSDLPNATNRSLIEDALELAIKNLLIDDELSIEPVLDRDTAGIPGSPDITQTIFAKIEKATAFVCDVSIINSHSDSRLTPNPNVLIELGYALKTLGTTKVVMVMNLEFSGPEGLPFDLRQKRIVTYKAGKTAQESKADIKKDLAKKLITAIKAILIESHKEQRSQAPEPTPADQASVAIKNNRPDQGRAIDLFMKWLASELKKLDPKDLSGEADENLIQALERSLSLVEICESLMDEAAAMNSPEAASALFKGFEHILTLCNLPYGFSGHYISTDFDFFKFIFKELLVALVAYLIRYERWNLFEQIADTKLYVRNARNTSATTLLNFYHFHTYIGLLDEVRRRRLGTKHISLHADTLKSRYENGVLASRLNWSEFIAADLLLFFSSFSRTGKNSWDHWWPHTAIYLGYDVPRFLIETETAIGSEKLTSALGLSSTAQLRETVKEALNFLIGELRKHGSFWSLNFDPNKIAMSENV